MHLPMAGSGFQDHQHGGLGGRGYDYQLPIIDNHPISISYMNIYIYDIIIYDDISIIIVHWERFIYIYIHI